MAYSKIRPRRGTAYEWASYNPIPLEGELVMEHPNAGPGTGLVKFKIGDGVRHYADLPYAFDGAAASSIDGGDSSVSNNIQIRGDVHEQWVVNNPVLLDREISYDKTYDAVKMGDGTSHWNDLPYLHALSIGGFGNVTLEQNTVLDFGNEDNRLSSSITRAENVVTGDSSDT